MFKQLTSGLSKFFTKERVLVLIIFLVIVWSLMYYSGSKTTVHDGLEDGSSGNALATAAPSVKPSVSAPAASAGYALQPVANPSDLLPKDQNSQWAALNPNTMNQGDVLMPDLLQAGYHIGIDTIGQTLRNANLQLRSDPIISKSV